MPGSVALMMCTSGGVSPQPCAFIFKRSVTTQSGKEVNKQQVGVGQEKQMTDIDDQTISFLADCEADL